MSIIKIYFAKYLTNANTMLIIITMDNKLDVLNSALREKQDNLRISLRDLANLLGVSDTQLVLFFQGKKKAGYTLFHGILCAWPEDKYWEPIIIEYLRQNGREISNCHQEIAADNIVKN